MQLVALIIVLLIFPKLGAQNVGYILFCPCMGRFGNQVEQYLGALRFARALNRTLVLPPFLEYPFGQREAKIVPFSRVFQVSRVRQFYSVVTMEEFMAELAPTIWPGEEREVFCWAPRRNLKNTSDGCQAKDGNPFAPFWNHYNVDFVDDNYFGDIGHDVSKEGVAESWTQAYPTGKHPVIAFSSAPASFPARPENRHLQFYFKWSETIAEEAKRFVKMHLPRPIVGIHLRNNIDWEKACTHVDPDSHFFASAQCTGDNFEQGQPTKQICLPSVEQVLSDVWQQVRRIGAKTVFVSTDKYPMLSELNRLFNDTVDVRRLNRDDPYLSLAILDQADHLIANCMSTYSAFAVRQRLFGDSPHKSFSFFGFNQTQHVGHRKPSSEVESRHRQEL